jgi:hypothetical protein
MGFCNDVLYKIWGFRIGFVEDSSFLGCDAVSLIWCFLCFKGTCYLYLQGFRGLVIVPGHVGVV